MPHRTRGLLCLSEHIGSSRGAEATGSRMSQPLGGIFAELGISQYLDAFLDQGFDTWETILDITESDLDALGVKLGHRRKLQRRIANFRGVAPDAALVSPTQHSSEESRQDVPMPDAPRNDVTPIMVITKRKYRRHPKPDENAPERPPSAYVLFSNKMREDLKDRNLSFTEIAKLVGENWQALSVAEKEPFETQAQNAKDKYNSDMADYKKTAKYKKYVQYLQEFRAKHAAPLHDKDGPKRVKMADTHSSSNGTRHRARSQTTSGGSSVDGRNNKDSEPPPTREQRVNSAASLPEFVPVIDRHSASVDEENSPPPTLSSTGSPRGGDGPQSCAWSPATEASQQQQQQQQQQQPPQLPSLSNVLEGTHPPEANGLVAPHFQLHNVGTGPRSPSGLVSGNISSSDSRPPSLRHEYSSGASTTSSIAGNGSISGSYPRTPIDGSMPIHLLLSGSNGSTTPSGPRRSASPESKPAVQYPPYPHYHGGGHHSPHTAEPPGSAGGYFPPPAPPGPPVGLAPGIAKMPPILNGLGPVPRPQAQPPHRHLLPGGPPPRPGLPNLDGMSALLKAGEMVDRQAR